MAAPPAAAVEMRSYLEGPCVPTASLELTLSNGGGAGCVEGGDTAGGRVVGDGDGDGDGEGDGEAGHVSV